MNYIEFLHNRDKYLGENHDDFLMHYGVLGQKWGQRHWQNPDGTYTTEGKIRYFGSKKAQAEMNADETKIGSKTSDAKDYLKFRNKMLKERTRPDLNDWYRDKNKYLDKQLVRDAKRVDKQQQKMYKNQLKEWYDNPEDLVSDLNAMYKIGGKADQKIGGLFSKKDDEPEVDPIKLKNMGFIPGIDEPIIFTDKKGTHDFGDVSKNFDTNVTRFISKKDLPIAKKYRDEIETMFDKFTGLTQEELDEGKKMLNSISDEHERKVVEKCLAVLVGSQYTLKPGQGMELRFKGQPTDQKIGGLFSKKTDAEINDKVLNGRKYNKLKDMFGTDFLDPEKPLSGDTNLKDDLFFANKNKYNIQDMVKDYLNGKDNLDDDPLYKSLIPNPAERAIVWQMAERIGKEKKAEQEAKAAEKEAQRLEEQAKSNAIFKDMIKLDDKIKIDKYPKVKDELSDVEFYKIADDLENWDTDYRKYKANPEEYNKVADLGINALNKINKYYTIDDPDDGDREWFLYEDQTNGLPDLTYLYTKGYSKDYLKGLVNYSKDKFTDDESADKFYDDYPRTAFMYNQTSYNNLNNRFIDALYENKDGYAYLNKAKKNLGLNKSDLSQAEWDRINAEIERLKK